MTFRDDRDAQKHRIDALEEQLEEARAEAEALRQERDAALAGPSATEPKSFERGSAVWVEWHGRWWRAQVTRVVTDARWEVHYDGWSNSWDEAVGPERIAHGHQPAPGPMGGSGGGSVVVVLSLLMITVIAGLVYWWADSNF